MFDLPIFQTLLALILVFALLSLVVSSLMEIWNHYRKSRGKLLREAIHLLLRDPLNKQYGELVNDHFLIRNLSRNPGKNPPPYISSNLFAEALIDVIAQQARHTTVRLQLPKAGDHERELPVHLEDKMPPPDPKVMERFQAGLDNMQPSPLRDAFFSMLDKSGKDSGALKSRIEAWYNDYMESVSGWYKSRQMRKSMFFGFAVAILLNVDSIYLFRVFSMDATLRGALVATAEKMADAYQVLADSTRMETDKLQEMVLQVQGDAIKTDSLFSRLHLQDSVAQRALLRSDSLLGVVYGLNIPIGWIEDRAPLSWRWDSAQTKRPAANTNTLLGYMEARNARFSIWYILGVCISGFALGLGAPFWFDLLVKLVNLRMAGKKPSVETISSKN